MRSMIKSQKRANGGSTIFTTQTMTEAELLCDRIAIMVNGGFCCISNPEKLKKSLGGYNVTIGKNCEGYNKKEVEESLSSICEYKELNEGDDTFKLQLLQFKSLADIFGLCEELKGRGLLSDFWVSEMSLEDVFLICAMEQAAI